MASRRDRDTVREVTTLIERGPLHSSLYYWLLENHDEVVGATKAGPIRWEPLCAKFAVLGLTDCRGSVASVRTARQTWLRVRRAVRRARLLQATGVHVRPRGEPARSGEHNARLIEGASSPPIAPSPRLAARHAAASEPMNYENGDTRPGVAGPVGPDVAKARIAEAKLGLRRLLDPNSGR